MFTNQWGPHAWLFLHSITFQFPNKPTHKDKLNYKHFFESIQNILPCPKCRSHYSKNIKNLTSFVDSDITSYEGFKLEILYLISIIDQRDSKNSGSYKKTDELYLKIQENEKISNALKERVKKINDYQKYK